MNNKSNNALSHGLYARDAVLPWEDADAFAAFHQSLRNELRPDGPLEEETVFDIAELHWRKRRLTRGGVLPFYKEPPPPKMVEAARGDVAELAAYLTDPANAAQRSFVATGSEMLDYIKSRFKGSGSSTGDMSNAPPMLGTPTSSSVERAYDPVRMEAQLKTEMRIDARIAKLMGRLMGLKAYKELHCQQPVEVLPPVTAPPVASPPPSRRATPLPMSGADLYR